MSNHSERRVFKSSSIFAPHLTAEPFDGYLVLAGSQILGLYPKDTASEVINEGDFIDLGSRTICPSFTDTHCFFTGYAYERYCDIFDLPEEKRDPERNTKLLAEMFLNRDFILEQFESYMKMHNSRGITAIKEMGFDNFYGFTELLELLEFENRLSLRVHFMSQAVERPADLAYARRMRETFKGGLVRFSGFNQMTDGSISAFEADLKQPYEEKDGVYCQINIDYDAIKEMVLHADREGFRVSLHAQGDGAVKKALAILDCCEKDDQGRLLRRHALTDLELTDPTDLSLMGRLGVVAEIYPQIPSLSDRKTKEAMIIKHIGPKRGKYFWNRRAMQRQQVVLSCATDLPLLYPNIPESIYHGCGGFFPEGGEPFNKENTLTPFEMLQAWSSGGAYNLGAENEYGSLAEGMSADFVIFDGDLFNTAIEDSRQINVLKTYFRGQCVYTKA